MSAFRLEVHDQVARVQLDVPNASVNTISSAVKDEFEDVLTSIEQNDGILAAILVSGKPHNFIAGADIDEFVALQSRDEALALVQGGQSLVERVASLSKPLVAAIHGVCLGGGLETALACRYRVATNHRNTKLGLPEVQLGIIPAAGGCQRLPRLIGLRAALDMILTGKSVPARRAFKLGLVDELVHPSILEQIAWSAALRLASGSTQKRSRTGVADLVLDRNPLGWKLVFGQARKTVLSESGGHYPAPLAALEAVEHGLRYGLQAGLDSEAAHFAELAVGEVARNLVRIFFATTALKKDYGIKGEVDPPDPVRRVAVVGAGFMGSAIAAVTADRAGVDVRIRDVHLKGVAKGLRAARGILDERLARRRMTKFAHRRTCGLLSGGVDWAGFESVDVVVEAVFEDLNVKHDVFRAVEERVGDTCILASNTSTIPISDIAQAVKRPERVLGMHFFSPAEKMPLLEVIVTDETADWATARAVAFGRAIGKTVIVVKDHPGFWVNRILAPYMNEAGHMLLDGVSVETLDKVMTSFGFPVGPITLLDEIGLDVAVKAAAVLYEAFGDRLRPIEGLGRMTEDGRLGRKSGHGFYRYEGGKKRQVDQTSYEVVGARADSGIPKEDVELRLVFAMLNEAVLALDEGVVRSPRDGDVGAIFGIGFPAFRGGPLRYIDELGADLVLEVLEELATKYGDRFDPAPRLQRMATSNERFYPDP